MSGVCIVETQVTYRAWCSDHGHVGPSRDTEAQAREDAEHHEDCGCGGTA